MDHDAPCANFTPQVMKAMKAMKAAAMKAMKATQGGGHGLASRAGIDLNINTSYDVPLHRLQHRQQAGS